jgi:DNA mismatch endonuclease, patch repair protein
MADVLTPEQRRLNMRRIRGRDTKPELLLRRGLHAAGLRFRLHAGGLPGRPDIVFSRYRAAILVHGCFWHGHDCPMFRLPATRPHFWAAKIAGNRARDLRNRKALVSAGWRILTIWECSMKGPARRSTNEVVAACIQFLRGTENDGEVVGIWTGLAAPVTAAGPSRSTARTQAAKRT